VKRRTSDRGHVHIELNVYIALAGIGAALAVPPFVKLYRHEAVTTGGWIGLCIGSLFFLAGVGMLARFFITAWLEARKYSD
jgi:hypothetical protein